ncbi:MAG: DegT/DnrJ/EryC1/StrS family aminotransferase [Bacteroidota bacterium]|nr:DegT/DnrJ/EryC1/StrS family aminotransferase [Bacteroidota bacterium]
MKNNHYVTSPLLPSKDELSEYINEIFDSAYLTNGGKFVKSLEKKLSGFLEVEFISLFSSGTLALALAIKSQNLTGEVITTPFTHVSTIQALYWNNLKPVFVDMEKSTLNICTSALEKAINPETCAILPVHIFGNPCSVKEIEKLSNKYNLKVIYDAAHCFGVKIDGQSVLNYGDLSVLSFHATKVFNTIEGGAVISHDKVTKEFLDTLANSGIDKNSCLTGHGLSSKMNEVQAAFGIASLNLVNNAIENRKVSTIRYRELIKNIQGIHTVDTYDNITHNYIYFPIIIEPNTFGATASEIQNYLSYNQVYAKRYFHPLISESNLFKSCRKYDLTNCKEISDNILCLPLSHKLTMSEIEYIVDLLIKFKDNRTRTD